MKEMGEILAQQVASAVKQQPTIELVTPQTEPASAQLCAPIVPPGPPAPCFPGILPPPMCGPTVCVPVCQPACMPSSLPRGCAPDYIKQPPPKPPRPS